MSVINESLIEYIIVHCSATKADKDYSAEDINNWHKQKGWTEIGYHFVIKRTGKIEIGRDLDSPGAHVKGYNAKSWGICLIGGLDENGTPENNFTYLQFIALKLILSVLKLIAFNAEIKGHNEFPNISKACPCFSVKDWLAEHFDG